MANKLVTAVKENTNDVRKKLAVACVVVGTAVVAAVVTIHINDLRTAAALEAAENIAEAAETLTTK